MYEESVKNSPDTDTRKELWGKSKMKLGTNKRYEKERQTAFDSLKIKEQQFMKLK